MARPSAIRIGAHAAKPTNKLTKSRPDRGLLKMRTRTFNQNGEVVQEVIANGMVPRRPPRT